MLSNHSHIPCNLRGFLGREKEKERAERERERCLGTIEIFIQCIIIIAPIH